MVRTRVDGFTNTHRKTFTNLLKKYGNTGITLTSKGSYNTDSMGNLTSAGTDTTSTITAELQYVTQADKDLLAEGWVEIGDAILFAKHDESLSERDEITSGSESWVLTQKRKLPEVLNGNAGHLEWVCKLKK